MQSKKFTALKTGWRTGRFRKNTPTRQWRFLRSRGIFLYRIFLVYSASAYISLL